MSASHQLNHNITLTIPRPEWSVASVYTALHWECTLIYSYTCESTLALYDAVQSVRLRWHWAHCSVRPVYAPWLLLGRQHLLISVLQISVKTLLDNKVGNMPKCRVYKSCKITWAVRYLHLSSASKAYLTGKTLQGQTPFSTF